MTTLLRPASARMALTLGRIAGDGAARQVRSVVTGPRARRRSGVPGGAAPTAFDPVDPATMADPYASYARLHKGPRLVCNRERRVWIVSRYEDVRAAARAHDALSSAESITPSRSPVPMLLSMDRPEHTRLRRIVARHFTRDGVMLSADESTSFARAAARTSS